MALVLEHGAKVALLGVGLALALGCSSETGNAVTPPNDGGTPPDGGDSAPPPECAEGPGYGQATPKQFVQGIGATVVDLDGQPAAGELAQVCGTDLCINGTTDGYGSVAIPVNQELTKPAFKYGLGVAVAKFALLLSTEPEQDLGTIVTARFPDLGTGVKLEPGKSATSSGVTLELAPDAVIDLNLLDFRTDEEQSFRAVQIPAGQAPAAVDPSLGLELVYATTPVETTFCPHASLTVPNSLAWEPGTPVEFFVHGIVIDEAWAPYGGWGKVSDGAVSADGASVVTDEAGGIPILSVIGIRRAP
jgi:hypothetical protein